MAFTPLIRRCRETSLRETSAINVDQLLLPRRMARGKYVLHEFYCDDPRCDCRAARIVVVRGELGQGLDTEAVHTVGWEPQHFYTEAHLPFAALSGSFLAPEREQGPWAWILAELLRPFFADRESLDELAEHYSEFRGTLHPGEN